MKQEINQSIRKSMNISWVTFILSITFTSVYCQTQSTSPASDNTFNALVLTTAFDLPIVRFNLLEEAGTENQNGNVEFFNSVGAGIGFKFGQIQKFKNDDDEEFMEFSNFVGLSAGVLFSSSETENGRENVFAPTIGISILDLKVALGYELGDRLDGVKPVFLTIAYGIPLSRLTRKSGLILKNFSTEGKTKASFF